MIEFTKECFNSQMFQYGAVFGFLILPIFIGILVICVYSIIDFAYNYRDYKNFVFDQELKDYSKQMHQCKKELKRLEKEYDKTKSKKISNAKKVS